MGLNFGGGSAGLFPTSQAANVGFRTSTKIGGIRQEEQSILPDVAHGEIVLWQKGLGSYDLPDSSLDPNFWDDSTTIGTVTETASYVQVEVNVGAGAGAFNETVATNAMPALIDISTVEFRLDRDRGAAIGSNDVKLIIFGTTYDGTTTPSIPTIDDSIWTLEKKENGDWNLFDDGVIFDIISPSDNIIKLQLVGNMGANPVDVFQRIYDITVDGGTVLLARTADDKLFQSTMVPLT